MTVYEDVNVFYYLHHKVYCAIIHVGSALFPFLRKLNSPASKTK